MRNFQVLVDSDAFIGDLYARDAHHATAAAHFARLRQQHLALVTTSAVMDETATVLSHRSGQAAARAFLNQMAETRFPVIHIDTRLRQAATAIFLEQTRRGISMTDCANVAVMRHFHIPMILSFDRFYFKQMGLRAA